MNVSQNEVIDTAVLFINEAVKILIDNGKTPEYADLTVKTNFKKLNENGLRIDVNGLCKPI